MNNYDFYSNLQKYQENDIEHGIGSKLASGLSSAYNSVKSYVTGSNKQNTRTTDFQPTYYQKIDNAYGPGKARYFYSKEEWDAYQRELQGYHDKAQQDMARQNNLRQSANNPGADRAAKESALANAQRYKRESEQAAQRRESMQKMTSGRDAAMRQGQQSTIKQTEEERQRRAKFLENQQAARNAKMQSGQSETQWQQNKYAKQQQEYNKNAQAAKYAQANRGNKEVTEGQQKNREAQAEAAAKRNEAAQKMTSGRDAAISSAKQRDYEANTNRNRAKDIYDKQGKGEIVNNLIKTSKSNPGITAEELAEKCNVNPAQAQVMLYETTGIMVPSKSDVNKKKG